MFNKTRSNLYSFAKFLGDAGSVSRGTVGKRVARRYVGKVTGRRIGKMFR